MRKQVARERTERKTRGSVVALQPDEPINDSEPETTRIGFAVGPDRRPVDPERLRQGTKEALRAAFSDEAFLKAIGVKDESDAENAALLAIISNASYDILSIIMMLGARRAGYTKEQAAIMVFDDREKRILEAPTSRVIQKYLPDIGGKYRDEIMLAISLTNVIAGKIMLLRETAKAGATNGSMVAPEPTQPATTVPM